ncbi:MAG: iron complex transport system substrate-binding protein [Miltoncostaeaceae bacterium]|nr:iron complex transport system substrate-binding protein [Miltoncostaeaceae bacterium]
MRIVSLLPSVTEIVAALGLGDRLVGRTHECDHPPWVARVPALTESRLRHDPLDSAGIDQAVASAFGDGLYRLDEQALRDARPDLVITQALCEVCAVAYYQVEEAVSRLPTRPELLSLEPGTLDEVLASVATVGERAGARDEADRLVAALRERLQRARRAVAGRPARRVVCLEWLDPPYAAGHWVPHQVEAAGGHDPLGRPGRPSVRITDQAIAAADPELLVLMPCGWNVDQADRALDRERFLARFAGAPFVRTGAVLAVNGAAYFSRPGPRLVDGVELLAALFHPAAADPPPPEAARWLEI